MNEISKDLEKIRNEKNPEKIRILYYSVKFKIKELRQKKKSKKTDLFLLLVEEELKNI